MRALYSAVQAERELGIRASTVRSWARRHLIYSFGLDRRNSPLYDKRDLMRLRSRMRVHVADRRFRQKEGAVMAAVVCNQCDAPAMGGAPVDLCWDHIVAVHRFVLSMHRDRATWSPSDPLPMDDRKSIVYYIRVGETIKIGTTRSKPSQRFTDLPPDRQLLAVEPGDEMLERSRHVQFTDERVAVNREWFNPSPRLWRHIEELRLKHGAPDGEAHPLAG